MQKKSTQHALSALVGFVVFALFTLVVRFCDVRPIGPEGSSVGFAGLNALFAQGGVRAFWYELTELLGAVSILVAVCFAAVGLWQVVTRKSLRKVDPTLFVLAGFYVLVVLCYLFFEVVVINCRPVLMDGVLEASYPSSHTVLTVCIMASAATQLRLLLPHKPRLCRMAGVVCILLAMVTVFGRFRSGVHWPTDILGGIFLSLALVGVYEAGIAWVEEHRK